MNCGTVVGEGFKREQCHVLHSLPAFSHFPHHPQSNWALLVLIPGGWALCTFWDPVGLSNELSCEAGSFSCCHLNSHRCFQSEVWGFIPSPPLEHWGCAVCLTPQSFLPAYMHLNVGLPSPPATALLGQVCRLVTCPLHPGCPSLLLLLVLMNVSSLTS